MHALAESLGSNIGLWEKHFIPSNGVRKTRVSILFTLNVSELASTSNFVANKGSVPVAVALGAWP